MSWSLQLKNGDFTADGAAYGRVTNENKLTQDLRCAILERMGTDDAHREYGSLIDGGLTPEGREVPSPLGGNNWEMIVMTVESEIRRIALDHQQRQLARAQRDRFTYGSPTLTGGEILDSITDISFVQAQDTLLVKITLRTATGRIENITVPMPDAAIST